jgi:sulfate permease, SulP family
VAADAAVVHVALVLFQKLRMVVYRLDDRLFFANAGYVKGRIREAVRGALPPVNCVVFDAEAVTHVDATGLAALQDIARDLRKEDIVLVIARAKALLKEYLDDAGLTREIGEERFYATVRAAVEACS